MSWFDSPPSQKKSRWRAFRRNWNDWWETYWGIPLIGVSVALLLWVITMAIINCCEPSQEVEPREVYRVYEVELGDRVVTCIRLVDLEGFDCDWD